MNLTEVCVRKPVLAWMIMAAAIVFGLVTANRIGISQFPDVDFPMISVSVTWEGAAPEVVENDVVIPLEEALAQIESLRTITSTARMGSASISIELELSRNVDLALQDVQAKVSQAARTLPKDIDPPVISKSNPEDNPIMMLAMSGPYPNRVISDYLQYGLAEKLQTIPGVGEITMMGFQARNIRVWVDASKLDEKGLTVMDVINALQREHVELPAGRIESPGREINVRVLGEAIDLETLRKIIVREVNGAPVYVGDVALVEDGFEDVRRIARLNGVPAQGLGVKKQRGANAVGVAKAVKRAVDEYQKTLPEGLRVDIVYDATRFIEDSVKEIEFELLLSVILTALVCWMFLGSLSSTLNVILAIPMSLLGTVAVIYFLGFTFNTFTLLGMALAVGIVVDDAIMVMENIFRHREGGKSLIRAALEGTHEITAAALAATLAVIAIFIPVVFVKGIIGRFFLQFGITLCLAVLLSYLEAITLAPARCSQFLKTSKERRSHLGRLVDESFSRLSVLYGKTLQKSLARPGLILILAAILFLISIVVFIKMPSEFVPSQDLNRLMIRLQTAVGSDITEADRLVQKAENIVASHPEVKLMWASVGGMGGGGVNQGFIMVTLVPPRERKLTQNQIAAQFRRELNQIPGIRAVIQDLSQQGFTAQRGFPVEFSVRGANWDELVNISLDVMEKLRASGLVTDVDTDYQVGMPELRVEPDRNLCADLGVSIDEVATTLNALVGGVRVGKYSTGGRRIDVRLKLMAMQRSRPEDIARLRVRARNQELIPLSALVSYKEEPALQAITRKDRERAISFFANVAPGHSQNEALKYVETLGKNLPVGYRIVLGGSSLAFQESMSSLLFAMLLGIIVAYMILASQFNSYIDPVTIITILPLSIAGAVFALLIAHQSLNVFSMIGLLLLMGIVKKNSIILVDYANAFRDKGVNPREAMEKAGPIRLRPILMTATATLMAAIPPALGLGSGSEIRKPMSIAVIGGLVLSTLLSLVVVPSFYVLADKWFKKKRRVVEESELLTQVPEPASDPHLDN
ncbi:MAG TPA: efflux RND transporter permease subunit [Candidatus Aminicenantes bacterium]|nr:MAG: AcrB/AcrD/AcrF family protein [Candidatus Aminicenantes bacterium]HEK85316.1 efflux RND transporter permease subunit [Candidatus Aminicenantes bacterium]